MVNQTTELTKLVRTIKDCACSHCLYLLQRAYEPKDCLTWDDFTKKLDKMISRGKVNAPKV